MNTGLFRFSSEIIFAYLYMWFSPQKITHLIEIFLVSLLYLYFHFISF